MGKGAVVPFIPAPRRAGLGCSPAEALTRFCGDAAPAPIEIHPADARVLSRFPASVVSPGAGSGCGPGERDVYPHRLGRAENELAAHAGLQRWRHLPWANALYGEANELRRRLSGGDRRRGDQEALDALVVDALRRLAITEGQFALFLDRLCLGELRVTGRAADEPPGTRTDFAPAWWTHTLGKGLKRSTAKIANWRAQDTLHLVGQRPRVWRELEVARGTAEATDTRKGAAAQAGGRELLSSAQAAELVGCSTKTLARRRQEGDGPPYVRLSATRVLYFREDLVGWLRSLRASSTSEETVSAERRA